MFVIENGREHFYQWDTGQRLIIEDKTVVEVHFCNRTDECSLVCEVYTDGGKRLADVPNILLQNDWQIRVYAYCGNYTKVEKRFDVIKRSKPADYAYTETEVRTYNALESRIEKLENGEIIAGAVNSVNGKAGNVVLTAADVGALPDDTVIPVVPSNVSAFTNDAGYLKQASLAAYYTKEEADSAIDAAIDAIPATDLSNYYTKAQTNSAIKNAQPDLTPYATKNDISDMATKTDLSGYYTKTQTNTQITNALKPYAKTTALEGLATETYVNTKVADLVGTAPETLDTLGEIATALENNSEVVDTLNEAIGKKADKTALNGLATEKYVDDAIENMPKEDMSSYYTKAETNAAINAAKPDLTPYAKTADITDDIEAALTEAKASGDFDGEQGERGTGILQITTAPSSYTTAVGGITPTYRVAISTVKTQSKVDKVLVGDTVFYSYYQYPVIHIDSSYAYLDTRKSVRGATGSAGKTPVKGTDYWTDADTAAVLTDNSESWVFTFKDGTTATKKVVLA